MIKVVVFFLIIMAVVALISNLISPGSFWRQFFQATGMRRCPKCGRPLIGKTCVCRGRG